MRRLTLLCTLVAVLLGATAGGASATTFNGACQMTGKVIPTTPYTFVPKNMDAELFASGTCSGSLNGRPYDGPAHLYLDGRMQSPMSCGLLVATNVPGTLTFARDPRTVDATLLDVIAAQALELAGQMPINLTGAYNGHALTRLVLASGEEELSECAGDGLDEVEFELDLDTLHELYG